MWSSSTGFDFQAAELAATRARLTARGVGAGHAQAELTNVKEQQRNLAAARARRLAEIHAEAETIQSGDMVFLVHALVAPAPDPRETERYDAEVEAVAVRVATAYETRDPVPR